MYPAVKPPRPLASAGGRAGNDSFRPINAERLSEANAISVLAPVIMSHHLQLYCKTTVFILALTLDMPSSRGVDVGCDNALSMLTWLGPRRLFGLVLVVLITTKPLYLHKVTGIH